MRTLGKSAPPGVAWAIVPVFAIFAVCVVNAYGWIGRPFSGFLFLDNCIVVSIGRSDWWSRAGYQRLAFARVLAVDGQLVASGREILAYVESKHVGAPVTYTVRRGDDVFRLRFAVRKFTGGDFVELFAPMLGVGLLILLVGAAVVIALPAALEARALFVASLSIGLTLITGPDEYGPYWFPDVFFLSLGAIPPACVHSSLIHLRAGSVFRRGIAHVVLYGPFLGFGAWLRVMMFEPSEFLPLLFTAYHLVANAGLMYLGSLVFGLTEDTWGRTPVVRLLVCVAGCAALVMSIRLSSPVLQHPVSPTWLLAPLLGVPPLMGVVLLRLARLRGSATAC